jgi:hypothetical protein
MTAYARQTSGDAGTSSRAPAPHPSPLPAPRGEGKRATGGPGQGASVPPGPGVAGEGTPRSPGKRTAGDPGQGASVLDPGVPGEVLLGWLPAIGGLCIALNAFWLRLSGPGWLSGKLSDVGICLLLPVLLFAGAQWVAWAVRWPRAWRARTPLAAAFACFAAGGLFAAIEIWPPAERLYVLAFEALFGLATRPTRDASDLLALLFLPAANVYLRRAGR